MIVATTPNGKVIETYYVGRNIAIRFSPGCELPRVLSGLFTSEREAQIAIYNYLSPPIHIRTPSTESSEMLSPKMREQLMERRNEKLQKARKFIPKITREYDAD